MDPKIGLFFSVRGGGGGADLNIYIKIEKKAIVAPFAFFFIFGGGSEVDFDDLEADLPFRGWL